MRSIILAVAVLALSASVSNASETKTVERQVTIYTLDDAPTFKAKLDAVCSDKSIKLSAKARTACDTSTFPKVTKALQFRNAGIGAEFNALAAQR